MKCVICDEETESKEEGICYTCQRKICEAFGVKVAFLDEDPFLKVIPKEKEPIYNFIATLSQIISNAEYAWHALKHHSHKTKQVEVVDIE